MTCETHSLFYAWAVEMLVGICGYCFIALKGGVLKGSKESKLRGTLIFMAALLPQLKDDRKDMIEEGFGDFLSKPIDISELRGVLIRYLGVYQS